MAWELDYWSDGTILTGTNMTDVFNSARLWIDSTEADGWRKGMFNHHQAAETMRVPGSVCIGGDESSHTYDEATFGASLQYAAYGQDGGTDVNGNIGSGDRTIIGHPSATGYTGGKALLSWTGSSAFRVGMTNETDQTKNVSAVEVLFNCEIRDVSNPTPAESDVQVMFCIQYKHTGSTTWWTLDESERFYSIDNTRISTATDGLWIDASIRVLIDADIIDEHGIPGTDELEGIRVMVSKYSSASTTGNVSIELGSWNLTAIPWRAKDVA